MRFEKLVKTFYVLALLLAIVVSFSTSYIFATQLLDSTEKDFDSKKTIKAVIGDARLILEIADTPEKRERGLSYRSEICSTCGLFMMFDLENKYGIWMKDMNFSIDVVWLDADKKVLDTEENLRTDSYPRVFYSPSNTRYAVEVPAGTVKRTGIKNGDLLETL